MGGRPGGRPPLFLPRSHVNAQRAPAPVGLSPSLSAPTELQSPNAAAGERQAENQLTDGSLVDVRARPAMPQRRRPQPHGLARPRHRPWRRSRSRSAGTGGTMRRQSNIALSLRLEGPLQQWPGAAAARPACWTRAATHSIMRTALRRRPSADATMSPSLCAPLAALRLSTPPLCVCCVLSLSLSLSPRARTTRLSLSLSLSACTLPSLPPLALPRPPSLSLLPPSPP